MVVFEINHPQGLPTPEELGTAALFVLKEPSLDIRGDPGVEGVVGAEDDVDLPVHSSIFPAGVGWMLVSSSPSTRSCTCPPVLALLDLISGVPP